MFPFSKLKRVFFPHSKTKRVILKSENKLSGKGRKEDDHGLL